MSTFTTLKRRGRRSLLCFLWAPDSRLDVCEEDYWGVWEVRKWVYKEMERIAKWKHFKFWEASRIESIAKLIKGDILVSDCREWEMISWC